MTRAAELRAIRARKQGNYPVRTRFVDAAGEPRHINELVATDSPYLLQHAHNPVHWFAWGTEAFDQAAAGNKPIFLSVGYSTCHWCHVMEEECFDDEAVADVLNRHFVAIKIDREQRPGLDAYYMTAVQLINGQGGWPMSCFLTPDGRPFFGATYIPKAGFLQLLEQVRQAWQQQPERLHDDAARIDDGIRQQTAPAEAADLPADVGARAVAALVEHADTTHGGFGTAPKFPQEPLLMLVAEQVARDGRDLSEQPAWAVLRNALDAMRAGGMHDQVGGGFHRYATDAAWQVPHFEKMLYNQGQLAGVYLSAWQLSGIAAYREVVETTLDYLLREMQAPEGGFYSATDADSDGAEGRYFIWHYDELAELLDADELACCEAFFGVTRQGNFEGSNILHQARPRAEAAAQLELSAEAFAARLHGIRQRLYTIREQRPRPLRDDKHIAAWNGMVITALARAARLLDRPDYADTATRAAIYLWQTHYDAGREQLWRISLQGTASVAGQIEDYAHAMAGFIALYDATTDDTWLDRAQTLLAAARRHHWDDDNGGFFGPPPQSEGPQPMRDKSLMDNATVSGNSLMPSVLAALHARTGDAELRTLARQQMTAFSGQVAHMPLAAPLFLVGQAQWQSPTPDGLQYFGAGAIRAHAAPGTSAAHSGGIVITLAIRDGWHIQPLGDTPDATQVHIQGADADNTGIDVEVSSSTGDTDMSLSGRVTLQISSEVKGAALWLIELTLQPCTERECLPGETRRFVVHPHACV